MGGLLGLRHRKYTRMIESHLRGYSAHLPVMDALYLALAGQA